MRVSVTYTKKVPIPGVEYASHGHHLTIEVEPPPEIQEDRDRLRKYLSALFSETRERVDEALEISSNDREPIRPAGGGHRASGGSQRRSARPQNGRAPEASPKQINYLRSLASNSGMSYRDLEVFAHDQCGVSRVQDLTKRQASDLIDRLRPNQRRA